MNPIAFSFGSHVIYWSGLVMFLAVAACFSLTMALFTAHGGRPEAVWLLLPLALFLSVVFSRFLHWYCHSEQYTSLWKALTTYSTGGYVLTGALAGTALAGLLVKKLGFTGNLGRLYDCLAPGAVLAIALLRLSELWSTGCRGKIVVEKPLLQHLPLASSVPTASGVEYRFATFFVEFLALSVLFLLVLRFFRQRRRWPMKASQPRDGNVALMFLNWYCAVEFVADSTRYDSSFMPINGFVSLVQVVSGVILLAVLVVFSVRSIRANGRGLRHWLLWGAFFLAVAATGLLEYLIQRHGNWYLACYAGMSLSCFFIAWVNGQMYRTVCAKKQK